MYPPHHLGGYELMWRGSVRSLRADGHTVRVLTTDYENPSFDRTEANDEDVHRDLRWYWRDHEWPRLSVRDRIRLERWNLDVLDRNVTEHEPDVIAWWAMGGMSMSLIEDAFRRQIPGIGVVHDDWLLYGPQEDQWQRFARRTGPFREALGRAVKIPTRLSFDPALEWMLVSRVILERARAGGWRLPRSVVAHSGVDDSLFRPHEPVLWRRRLLYVGRIDPRKGVLTAIRALQHLPEYTLSVVGGGDTAHLAEIEAETQALQVSDRVSFERHPRDQLPSVYARADAVLFPTIWEEPWGLVPLEAMAVGRPVIATGTGGSGDYLEHDVNALLYGPPEDDRALALAVLRLAGDDQLRRSLLSAGRETASRLTESVFHEAFRSALGRVIARDPASRRTTESLPPTSG